MQVTSSETRLFFCINATSCGRIKHPTADRLFDPDQRASDASGLTSNLPTRLEVQMSDETFESVFRKRLESAHNWLFWGGVGMVVLGVAAVVFPLVSTVVVELLVGWILLLSGVLSLWGSFSIHGTGPFFAALLTSLLSIAAGIFLLFNPPAGVLALTLMLAVVFMVDGAFEIVFAFELRPYMSWGWMFASGMASVLAAVLIAAGWPQVSAVVLP
jgi:uncharacterized membrane protein HdeD (DUF308 family)